MARFASLIENGSLVAVRGRFERDDESARMQTTEIFPLASLRERLSKAVRIRLNGDCTRQKLEALWELLSANQGDRPVALELDVKRDGRTLRDQCRRHAADPRPPERAAADRRWSSCAARAR